MGLRIGFQVGPGKLDSSRIRVPRIQGLMGLRTACLPNQIRVGYCRWLVVRSGNRDGMT